MGPVPGIVLTLKLRRLHLKLLFGTYGWQKERERERESDGGGRGREREKRKTERWVEREGGRLWAVKPGSLCKMDETHLRT